MATAATSRTRPIGLLCIAAAVLASTGCAPPQWRAIVTNASAQAIQVDLSQAGLRLGAGQSMELKDAQIKRLKATGDGVPTLRVHLPDASIKCYALAFAAIPDDYLGSKNPRAVHVVITADGRAVALKPSAKSTSEMSGQEPALAEVACP